MNKNTHELAALLRDCRIQATYQDVSGRRRRATVDALLALLQAFGLEIADPAQSGKFLHRRRYDRLARGLEPVFIAWNGLLRSIEVNVPTETTHAIEYCIEAETETLEGGHRIDEMETVDSPERIEMGFTTKRLPLPKRLPWGYHSLTVTVGEKSFKSLIISAPRTSYQHNDGGNADRANGRDSERREMGCFLPLYALRTERDWGIGDYSALGELASWAGQLNACVVGTLPVLAAFLDEPFEISPYRPASRMFWNELYLDVPSIPELAESPETRSLVESSAFQQRVEAQRTSELVGYREVARLKREVLEPLAARFFERRPSQRYLEFESYCREHSEVDDYSAFRAACERERKPWSQWPARMRDGVLDAGDFDPSVKNYHKFVQWLSFEQLSAVDSKSEAAGSGLYLDLPVGVDPAGYDVWRYQPEYLMGASCGAPPDLIFRQGQNWGLPPFHPERMRESGYQGFRQALSTNTRFARHLRIDHILGFHRMYCVPPGLTPDQGTYVQYEPEEMYAIAILESHRNRCELIGEDLGTVPASVGRALRSHAISGMWVAPYELEAGRRTTTTLPSGDQIAMLNTHDMPPLASWWEGSDIADRVELGVIDQQVAAQERDDRRRAKEIIHQWIARMTNDADKNAPEGPPLFELLKTLATSPARLLLINLEDLWFESRAPNVPGTTDERPNWQYKARYPLEEFTQQPFVLEILHQVNESRQMKKPQGEPRHVEAY